MDRRAMLDEIIRLTAPPQLEEGEFTAYDYIESFERNGLPPPPLNTAHRWLKKQAASYRKVLLNGRWTIAYRMTECERQGDEG